MRVSKLFSKTYKEAPGDAEIISHKLLLRSGMIKKLSQGTYSFLPLGYRVLKKISNIVRMEMDMADCQEVSMPIIQPSELWEESGRWGVYGDELMRLKDRNGKEFCLGPTHEEVITDIVRKDLSSYKSLPLNLYQIQNKYRDERRPRFGLMRSREFLMKDGYSFDRTEEDLEKQYQLMYDAYVRIFTRCGLTFRGVEADSGEIGGAKSHEFMVIAENGESEIAYCKSCDYGATAERANFSSSSENIGIEAEKKTVHTKNIKSIEEVCNYLNVSQESVIKSLIYKIKKGELNTYILVAIRGSREANILKIKKAIRADKIELASEEEIINNLKIEKGYIGPFDQKIMVLVDEDISKLSNCVVGANKKDYHIINFSVPRDLKIDIVGDFSKVKDGDDCPLCGKKLYFAKGIEVGQVFKLGDKYSKSLGCTYKDEGGKEQFPLMGCYGIGISRTMAASVEQNFDENGIIWPKTIAPYHVIVIPVNIKDSEIVECAENIYSELQAEGVEVIIDDSSERAGAKFANADLIGYPIHVTIGKKIKNDKIVDLKIRATGEKIEVPIKEVVSKIKRILL